VKGAEVDGLDKEVAQNLPNNQSIYLNSKAQIKVTSAGDLD